jgi:hypothetical protein
MLGCTAIGAYPSTVKGIYYTGLVQVLIGVCAIFSSMAVMIGAGMMKNDPCFATAEKLDEALATCYGTAYTSSSDGGSADGLGTVRAIGDLVIRLAAPTFVVGLVSVIVAVTSMIGSSQGRETLILAVTVLNSVLAIAFVAIAAYGFVLGSSVGLICTVAGFANINPTGSDDSCVDDFNTIIDATGCEEAPKFETSELYCFSDGSAANGFVSRCSCQCKASLVQGCSTLPNGMLAASVFCFIAALTLLIGAIMGCALLCCNADQKEQMKSVALQGKTAPSMTTTAVQGKPEPTTSSS